MNKNLQDIDHLFLRVLKDYKEDPPENIWQQIDNDLNRIDAVSYTHLTLPTNREV